MRDLLLLPKAHLHLHFTGSLAPTTLVELAAEAGVKLPQALLQNALTSQKSTASATASNPTQSNSDPFNSFGRSGTKLPQMLRFAADERGWFRFQRLYDAARACVRTEAAMRRIVNEAVAADAAEGSVRLEMQVDPTSYAPHVGGITPALEIIVDEAEQASQRHGVEVGLIVAASRMRHPLEARTLARLAAQFANHKPGLVVGFGLSNDERAGDTAAFAPAFRLAREAGLAAVPHGGELCGPRHVAQIFTDLQPRRLGHGVRTVDDKALLQRLVDAGVALEVCPSSNVSLGVYPNFSAVPLPELAAAGATIALGADDPLLFGSRLLDQYQIARSVHGFDDDAIAELARGSIRASLASAESKNRWLNQIEVWLL
jgi:adenosine deaminase